MIVFFGKTKFEIKYSFILIVSFVIFMGYKNALYVLLFSSMHEMGHLLFLYIFGGTADKIQLSYFGLALSYSSKLPRFKECVLLAAGPLINLIMYIILKDDINLMLFFLNSLPIFPLDCGRILDLYLPHKTVKVISMFSLSALIVLSIIILVNYKIFSLLLITTYLIIANVRYL